MRTWKKALCAMLAACMCMGLAGCKGIDLDTPSPAPGPDVDLPVEDTDIGGGVVDLGVNPSGGSQEEYPMHQVPVDDFDAAVVECAAEAYGDSSWIISPLSFRAAMCLAIAGAGGETRNTLLAACGFGSMTEMTDWYTSVMGSVGAFTYDLERDKADAKSWGSEEPDRAFRVLCSVWNNSDKSGPFLNDYVKYVEDTFGAVARTETADEITDAVNSWADESTDGLIPVLGTDLSESAAVLANAVYLRCPWVDKFSPDWTEERPFHGASGDVMMDFMNRTDSYGYFESDGARFLSIPMYGCKALVVRMGDGLSCDPAEFLAAYGERVSRQVALAMPKLDMETDWNKGELTGYLLVHEAASAMSPDYADFSKMSASDWYIGDIVQRARLKTDEDGLEAAAVTAVMMTDSAMFMPVDEIIEFTMDEPFTFLILDTQDAANPSVLFAGQFTGVV